MKRDSISKLKDRNADKDSKQEVSKRSKPTRDALHNKPFKGRVFYFDLPSNAKNQILENDIKTLGGTVEKFFSKEIKYLVSSKPEARYAQRLLPDSPAPSPESAVSSPHPSGRGHRGSSQGAVDTVTISRGKSLVEKAVKERERVKMNGILGTAVEWGVRILHVDDLISYVDKKKAGIEAAGGANSAIKASGHFRAKEKSTLYAGKISRPFVKVEDASCHYRPIILRGNSLPTCNLRGCPPNSPFLIQDIGADEQKKSRQRSLGERGDDVKRERRRLHEGREKRKGGYCECCSLKFDNLKAHLESKTHQTFSKSSEYNVIDAVVAGLTCDILNVSTQCRRVKCSTSTAPAGKSESHQTDLGSADMSLHQDHEDSLCLGFSAKHPRKRSRAQFDALCESRDDAGEQTELSKSLCRWEAVVPESAGGTFFRKEQKCGFDYFDRTEIQTREKRGVSEPTESVMMDSRDVYTDGVRENQDLHLPSGSLVRMVRHVRPRKRKEVLSLDMDASSGRQSLSFPADVEQCEKLSAPDLNLWKIFQSSDNTEQEFKGFSE